MNENRFSISAVILAGGKSSRYDGKNKAFLKMDQHTFYHRTISLLEEIFEEIIVITNNPHEFPEDNISKFPDIIKEIGPLGGIHSALTNAKNTNAIFVVAADMPFLSKEIISIMITEFKQQKSDILIPRIENRNEPLHAIYSSKILGKLNNFLQSSSDYSIKSFFKHVNTAWFDLEAHDDIKKAFVNINSQEDYDSFIQ